MKVKTATICLVAYLVIVTIGYAVYQLTLPATYTAISPELTSNLSELAFGDVAVGDSAQVTITLTNTGNVDFETLTMTHDLSATEGTLTWNIEDQPLVVGASIDATFTLTLLGTATPGANSFSVYIGE